MPSTKDYDDDEDIPLQYKRPFGSGLKRREILFVPASSEGPKSPHVQPSRSVADSYLDIVLSKESRSLTTDTTAGLKLCEVCHLPLEEEPLASTEEDRGGRGSGRHETSITHQVCLKHSHPPSAIDRSRLGLAVLQAQGWDPDSRTGLGASQQGVLYPIKAKPKDDTLGIGVRVPKDLGAWVKPKVKKLDAKGARKMAIADKKRREKLQQQFYGSGDWEKYLGAS